MVNLSYSGSQEITFPKHKTKTARVFVRLLLNGSITSVDIQTMFSTTSPRDYIASLRRLGWTLERQRLPHKVSKWTIILDKGFTKRQVLKEYVAV